MYKSLSDAAIHDKGLAAGDTEIWYAQNPSFRVNPARPDLARDYAMVGKISLTDPEKIFRAMQAEIWSPEGEARDLILGAGLRHTSMSVGDVIVIGDRMLEVAMTGFVEWPNHRTNLLYGEVHDLFEQARFTKRETSQALAEAKAWTIGELIAGAARAGVRLDGNRLDELIIAAHGPMTKENID